MSNPQKKRDKAVILIVDDKPANILVLESLLATPDRTLLSAANGKDALMMTLNNAIDLIILDVQMPGMDGFEVAQILKSNKRTSDIPIIFATAENKEHKFIMKGYDEGAIDYLFKPLDMEITRAKVAVLLKVQLQRKELVEKNASLQKSELLINNSADIIGIIDIPSFKIEEINQAFTAILGFSVDEARGMSLSFFLDHDDRAMVKNLSEEGQQRLSFETRVYCKDRSMKWLQWNVVVKDQKWYVNARDITKVKEVEEIRNYLATVVKQSNDAIYIHDHDGKIISWNEGAEKIYGYTEAEALKMKVGNIIPEYLQTETGKIVQHIILGEKIQELETKRITKHGKLIDVLFTASVIHDAVNDKNSIAITERDVTQQKKADEQIHQLNAEMQAQVVQLEAANKDLEAFTYSVSHDLRSPLRAMSGCTRIIMEDFKEVVNEEMMVQLDQIDASAGKMGKLIDDLLTFSKLGKKGLHKQRINMQELVEDVVVEIGKSIQHKATVQVHPMPDADADYILLNQVWINLISNAVKYSSKREQPLVEIGARQGEHETVYFVRDNGAGFSMEYASRLFGVFQRLHSSDEFEGTGIGLAIVHRIISRHEGKIWAEGKVDEGATFFFSLPA